MTATLSCTPIEQVEVGSMVAEFGRIADVERLYGVKRGLCYQLIAEKRIRSVCLSRPGAKTGVRLVHLASISELLHSQMEGGE